jgi:hypothetical protein
VGADEGRDSAAGDCTVSAMGQVECRRRGRRRRQQERKPHGFRNGVGGMRTRPRGALGDALASPRPLAPRGGEPSGKADRTRSIPPAVEHGRRCHPRSWANACGVGESGGGGDDGGDSTNARRTASAMGQVECGHDPVVLSETLWRLLVRLRVSAQGGPHPFDSPRPWDRPPTLNAGGGAGGPGHGCVGGGGGSRPRRRVCPSGLPATLVN